jgi:hypothetical protein
MVALGLPVLVVLYVALKIGLLCLCGRAAATAAAGGSGGTSGGADAHGGASSGSAQPNGMHASVEDGGVDLHGMHASVVDGGVDLHGAPIASPAKRSLRLTQPIDAWAAARWEIDRPSPGELARRRRNILDRFPAGSLSADDVDWLLERCHGHAGNVVSTLQRQGHSNVFFGPVASSATELL